MSSVFDLQNVSVTYDNGVSALKSVTLKINQGEFLALIGLSGSGKSTLLRCLNGRRRVSSGRVLYHDKDFALMSPAQTIVQAKKIAMIFQNFNLIPRYSVQTNVLMGALSRTGTLSSLLGVFSREDNELSLKLLDQVGLLDKAHIRADQLSGGQQQRVAIARTLMQKPDVLLADEPVASLDPATSHSLMDHLRMINKDLGVTVICNLHFLSLAREYANRVVALKGGEIVYDGEPINLTPEVFGKVYGADAREVQIE